MRAEVFETPLPGGIGILALERGIDSLTVAVLMGHKDPSMLARVYQHISHNPNHLLDQARKATAAQPVD